MEPIMLGKGTSQDDEFGEAWFNWRAFARGISTIWKQAFTMKEQDLTGDLFDSEMRKALVAARPDLTSAGVLLSSRPSASELVEKLKRIGQTGLEKTSE